MKKICLEFSFKAMPLSWTAQQPIHLNGLLYQWKKQRKGPCTFPKLQPQGNYIVLCGSQHRTKRCGLQCMGVALRINLTPMRLSTTAHF